MKEKLLQFIWQFQYFNKGALTTSAGEELQIIHPGNLNNEQGPDFLNAKIQIGSTLWACNIELHINASDWQLHNHSSDANYKNIILHVVLNNDKPVKNIPALELQNRISSLLLNKYEQLMNNDQMIPCGDQMKYVAEITLVSWKERLVIERLIDKSKIILSKAQQNNYHWEEVFWQVIARNFGVNTNADSFETIAMGLPLQTITKHKNDLLQIEALLFGQAGMLMDKSYDEYCEKLKTEYLFLAKKYQLRPVSVPVFFLRMRPDNFPTIRIAQLSMLLHKSLHLFSKIIAEEDLKGVKKLLNVSTSVYWNSHYTFGEATGLKTKNLGKQMVQNIITNTIVPILFAYGTYHKKDSLKDKAIRWLQQLSTENNSITKVFTALQIPSVSAFSSQAFIQLKNEYCNKKRCLECAVGNAILKRSESL